MNLDAFSARWARLPTMEKILSIGCLVAICVLLYVATNDDAACRQLKNFGEVTDANYGAWVQLRFQCNPLAE